MMMQIKTVAEEFRRVSNKQMAETVKRNIRENVAFSDQLAKTGVAVKDLIQVFAIVPRYKYIYVVVASPPRIS